MLAEAGKWWRALLADARPVADEAEGFETYQKLGVAGFALALFLADAFSVADGLASTLYMLLLVWLAERQPRRTLLRAALLCIIGTAITYVLAHGFAQVDDAIFRRLVSCAGIIGATPVALNILRVRDQLAQQDVFLNLTDHPIIGRNAGDVITYWNGAAERLYGWSRREAVGMSYHSLLKPQFPVAQAEIRESLSRQGYWRGELANYGRDNRQHTVLSSWLTKQEGPYGAGVLDIGTDLTALHEAGARLRASEARYRTIFDTVRIGFLEQDFSAAAAKIEALKRSGVGNFVRYCREHAGFVQECARSVRLLDANQSARTMFAAQTNAELELCLQSLAEPQAIRFFSTLINAIATGAGVGAVPMTLRTCNGSRLRALISIDAFDGKAQMNSVLASIIDDTARHDMQEALSEAQERLLHVNKMTALGDSTAIIAHQVNHPLAAIIVNAEATRRWLNRAEPDIAEALLAIEAVTRNSAAAAKVLENVRAHGTGAAFQPAPFSLTRVIRAGRQLLEAALDQHNIRLTLDLPPDIPAVLGDAVQIEQVVVNLLMNAIEAVAVRDPPREIEIGVRPAEAHVLVRVQDNGGGIEADMLASLYTPFVTTKPNGMGLGLSICRSIIADHHGRLWAAAQGHGTLFNFTLPIAGRELASE